MLIKKCRELSILCNLDINISIFDRTINKLQQLTATDGFTIEYIYQMIQDQSKIKVANIGKKFKMSVVNCGSHKNQHDLNESDDSDDERKACKQIKVDERTEQAVVYNL